MYKLSDWEVVVEPTLGSVCHADLRYFSGNRRSDALQEKLPMALIHEGVGKVIHSCHPQLQEGQRVVVVPNIPNYLMSGSHSDSCCPTCQKDNGYNYCLEGRFLGSGFDGLAQSRLVVPSQCVIPIPDEIPDEIAVLSELCTVSYQALHTVKDKLKNSKVAVFGDGPVGFIVSSMIKHIYGLGKEQLTVFGADEDRLKQFDFATCLNVLKYDFSTSDSYDIAVDCTGGNFSASAINQAIDILNPLGEIILMGVTEEKVPINTRDVLEKGITLKGSSRSAYKDYGPVLEAMKAPEYQETLRKILPKEKMKVESVEDFEHVMEHSETERGWKKVLIDFSW